MGTERVALECERGMFSFDTTPNWSDPDFLIFMIVPGLGGAVQSAFLRSRNILRLDDRRECPLIADDVHDCYFLNWYMPSVG
jgi:hypothetical protein